jgi:hypothetical protein
MVDRLHLSLRVRAARDRRHTSGRQARAGRRGTAAARTCSRTHRSPNRCLRHRRLHRPSRPLGVSPRTTLNGSTSRPQVRARPCGASTTSTAALGRVRLVFVSVEKDDDRCRWRRTTTGRCYSTLTRSRSDHALTRQTARVADLI